MARSQKILLAALAGLAVVLIVCTIVVVKVVTDQQRAAAYTICMTNQGYPPGSITSKDQIEGAIEAAQYCHDR